MSLTLIVTSGSCTMIAPMYFSILKHVKGPRIESPVNFYQHQPQYFEALPRVSVVGYRRPLGKAVPVAKDIACFPVTTTFEVNANTKVSSTKYAITKNHWWVHSNMYLLLVTLQWSDQHGQHRSNPPKSALFVRWPGTVTEQHTASGTGASTDQCWGWQSADFRFY